MKLIYPYRLSVDESRYPAEAEAPIQPFLVDREQPFLALCWAGETGGWSSMVSRETLALALSQVTAAHILPPLVDLPAGVDLLNYRVELRQKLDPLLVRELTLVLESNWRSYGWEQVGPHTYLCVIGAGVAACMDMADGDEQLTLRYNNGLANELFHAGRAIDLPRSRLFLQTALYEKVNELLALLRSRCWQWF